MNKAKRNLELISGIASVIAGAFIIIACIISIVIIINFDRSSVAVLAIVFLIFEIIYAAALITFGVLLCLIPKKAFLIVLVVLFSILIFWYHISMMVAFTPLALVMACVCIANVATTSTAMNFEHNKICQY